MRKLDGFTAGIRRETERWLRTRHAGGPRSRPRNIATAWQYANMARPVLAEWSARYDHLREVTRGDVVNALAPLRGWQRQHTLIALRSLFAWARKNGAVFRNPTSRIRVSKLIQPLAPEQLTHPIGAANEERSRTARHRRFPRTQGISHAAKQRWTLGFPLSNRQFR